MSVTPEGCIGILHLIAFLPSPPQDESKVVVQRRGVCRQQVLFKLRGGFFASIAWVGYA